MEAKLLAHLQTRPIAQIALNSRENQDLQALKLMVVIDHQIAKKNMYSEMAKQPKLLQHLMTFYSFKNFQYFKYDIAKHFVGEKVLQCRNCELIAPYAVIQTHSAITHNLHLSGKKCAWCNELDLKLHVGDRTVQQCYENYLERNAITDTSYPAVIDHFYNLLRQIAIRLGVETKRNYFYNASTFKRSENLPCFDDDIDRVCRVEYTRSTKKKINQEKLDLFFKHAMDEFYAANSSRYLNDEAGNNNNMDQPIQNMDQSIQPNRFLDVVMKTEQTAGNRDNNHNQQQQQQQDEQENNLQQRIECDSSYGHTIATLLGSIQNQVLKEEARKMILNTAIKYYSDDQRLQ